MIRKLLGVLGACVALHFTPVAAQTAAPPGGSTAGQPSFDIQVRASDEVRELLERHLELRRYREVHDLEDAELARLITLAERDVRELVGTLGYFDPQVRITRESGARPIVVVSVDAGKRANVSEVLIEFEGDIAQSQMPSVIEQREAIRKDWRLPRGQPFTQERWNDAKTQAQRALVARHYLAGRISYSLADIDAPTAQARLGLKLNSGPVFRLGPMQVNGVQRYDPALVPRVLRLPSGSIYEQDKILRAQVRLTGSGYFDSAFIFVDPEGDPNGVPVQVTVREAPLQKVVLGVGITTDSGPRLSLEHIHNRMPGLGWRAVSRLQVEKKQPFAQTEWTAVPDERGWSWATLARVERLDDDTLVTHGQRVRFGRLRTEDHIERNVYAQYDHTTVQPAVPGSLTSSQVGEGSAISLNYSWTGRYFDALPFPTRGNGFGFEIGGGTTLTGNRSPFQRTVLRWLGLRPLGPGRLELRAEGGAVFAQSDAEVPTTHLFRTGGDTTVRGYGFRDIGVALPDGQIGPGRYMAVGSVEWQQPIRSKGVPTPFEGVAFVDAGAVADEFADLRASVGVGVGVRWRSPFGPLQLDLAYGVKPRKFRLHMNIGFVF